MKKLVLLFMALLVALSVGPSIQAFAQGKVVRLTLIDENGSGEDGSAQLTDLGDGTTRVELIMMNAPEGAVQPAHIHKGSCANLDPAPEYPLTEIKEGKSTTVVKASLAELTAEKHAINVHKSATEVTIYVSCGNLPTGTASSGPLTMEQATAKLLDQANEMLGTIKKKEKDASENAYTAYHATFAANEDAIKAKSADTQSKLDAAMGEVKDALDAGNYDKASLAAQEIVSMLTEFQTSMGTSTTAGTSSMSGMMGDLQSVATSLQNEIKNGDKDGSQAAYTKFHDLFAANESSIMAKTPDGQAHIESAMHEVRDALAAGDMTKAGAAAQELVNEVNDATGEMAGTSNGARLPVGGGAGFPVILVALLFGSFLTVSVGTVLRRKTN